ncbi:MAG: M56 family metallopeptidase [Candidatus Latescibacterota bacterium]
MNPDWFLTIVDQIFIWSYTAIPILSDLMLYSTIIGTIGLVGSFLLKRKGAVYQSLFLRLSLLAIIVTPLASFAFSSLDVKEIHLPLALVKSPDVLKHSIRSEYPPPEKMVYPQKEPIPSSISQESSPNLGKNSRNENYSASPSKDERAYLSTNSGISETGKASRNYSSNIHSSTPVKGKEEDKSLSLDIVFPFLYVIISLLWIFFSLFLLMKTVFYNLYIKHVLVTSYEANPVYVQTGNSIARELKVRPPKILQNPLVSRAFLAGIIHPTIVLPLNEHEVSMSSREIFLHEFAHMIRHDCLWGLICQAAKVLLPLQPLIWLISREIEIKGEYACDDYVVVHGKTNKGYAYQLYTIVSAFQPPQKEINVGMGIFSVQPYLVERIDRILDKSRTRYLTAKLHEVMSFILLFLSSVVLTGFFSFKGEAVKRQAMNGGSCSGKEKASVSIETVGNQQSSVDYSRISADFSPRTVSSSGESIEQKITIENNKNSVEESTHASEIIKQSDSNISSNFINGDILQAEPAREEQRTNITETVAAVISSPMQDAVLEKVIPVEQKGEGIRFSETNNQIVTYHAFVKAEPTELKINPGIGANQLPSGNITEQFSSLVSLGQNFQSLAPLDSRARTLHYASTSASQLDPVWSPDNKKIAFTDGKYGVWVVPAEGGEPVLVYDNYYKAKWKGIKFHSVGSMDTFCFTPDGKNLLFQYYVIDEARGTKVTILRDGHGNLTGYQIDGLIPFIMSVDIKNGTIKTVREEAEKGCYSSDGKYLGFIKYDHRFLTDPAESFHMQDITVMDTTKGEIRYLTYGQYRVKNFCFAPDNSSVIACMTPRDGSAPVGLYRIPIQGGKAERLPVELESESCDDLQCSENGQWIIYTEKKAEQQNIAYYDVLTGAQRRKTLQSATRGVSLSPDGKKFCAVMETGDAEPVYRLFTSAFQAVPAGVETVAPVGFALKGNFPNPFNQSTVIEYTLPSSGRVDLEIYNVLGQKIRRLVSETVQPGHHAVRWDGRTDSGQKVSSGTYIMRLSMGSYVMTKNMMVLK